MAGKFFIGIIVILTLYTLIITVLNMIADLQKNLLNAFIISGALTTLNIIGAFLIIMRIRNKKSDEFNKYFLGSMGLRFFGLVAVIFLIIKYANIHQIGFLVSLFLLYFSFQFWEAIIVSKYLNEGNKTE